ncbi:hypothetical protein PYCC9005_004782 [Savitreella phatthalungensis]
MPPDSPIESWTVDEVSEFLSSIDLDQYDDAFAENDITGDILVRLEHESLKDIGVESVGHRLTLLRAVYDIKASEGIPIEPEDWIPASVDGEGNAGVSTNAELSKDIMLVTSAIQQRDERIRGLEGELNKLHDALAKLREQLSPVFKVVKELQPLPTPEIAGLSSNNTSGSSQKSSLSRKYSTKKLFLGAAGSAPRQGSPTSTSIPHAHSNYLEPESPRSPQPPSSLLPSADGLVSRSMVPPPRPPPPSQSPFNMPRSSSPATSAATTISDHNTPLPTPASSTSTITPTGISNTMLSPTMHVPTPISSSSSSVSSASAVSASAQRSAQSMDAFKSFRVGLDDPCSRVLPAALKKYRINSDWREYALFICYGDTERCLALDEKPLAVFQELQRQNKNPVFMLRKQPASDLHHLQQQQLPPPPAVIRRASLAFPPAGFSTDPPQSAVAAIARELSDMNTPAITPQSLQVAPSVPGGGGTTPVSSGGAKSAGAAAAAAASNGGLF